MSYVQTRPVQIRRKRLEAPFKLVHVEYSDRMVLMIRAKEVFEVVEEKGHIVRIKSISTVFEVLTRKLENMNEILSDY